jgi:hypothetical protein
MRGEEGAWDLEYALKELNLLTALVRLNAKN